MNMNSQNNNLITSSEYFELLKKTELTPIESSQKKSFEDFIKQCQKYEELISPASQSILTQYNTKSLELANNENRTSHEEAVLEEFKNGFIQNENLTQEGPSRKLAKAGYIDAAVILTIILNVGFIVAMTILGAR